ncbi:hypothetical protein X975_17137, partial [Stegodyphus mimosarum]
MNILCRTPKEVILPNNTLSSIREMTTVRKLVTNFHTFSISLFLYQRANERKQN